jgi:hypothetical protein
MNRSALLSILFLILICCACQAAGTVCPEVTGTPQYLDANPDMDQSSAFQQLTPTPAWVEIGRKNILVDKIVEGPLCNDTWQGVVYVGCDVQVMRWQEQPLFLQDCSLTIEPGTVVYVADHNNSAYYNGCSCHTGEVAAP